VARDDARHAGREAEPAALFSEAVARRAAVREAHEEAKVVIHPDALVPLSHWTTPPRRPRRFATWFFVAHVPTEFIEVDAGEIEQYRWFTASEALSARDAGDIELPPPTFVTLDWARRFDSVTTAIASVRAETHRLFRYVPRVVVIEEGAISLYEGDAGYESGDPNAPGARHRLSMLKSGWRYEREPSR
jgi:hypothetical protein